MVDGRANGWADRLYRVRAAAAAVAAAEKLRSCLAKSGENEKQISGPRSDKRILMAAAFYIAATAARLPTIVLQPATAAAASSFRI